jgi:signal transduction histidine kinase
MSDESKIASPRFELMQDHLHTIHVFERHLGIPLKWLLFIAGLALLWGSDRAHTSTLVLLAFALYGMANVLFSYLFYGARKLILLTSKVVLLFSYVADILFASLLIYFTGTLGSELYLLYVLLAFKAVFYYPLWRPLLTPLYLVAPFYVLVLYYDSRSLFFLTDRDFLMRYLLLFGVMLAVTYLGWLMEDRQKWIVQLSLRLVHTRQDLESKTELMQRTARDLGNRVMELRSLQEGVKAINSALALDKLLRLIVANAAQVLGSARCSIALLEGGEVATMAASGVSPLSLWRTRFKWGEGVAGWVVQNVKPALIGDVRRDDRFVRIGEEPIASLMCVPLVSGKTAIGALSATSPRLSAFTAEDLSRLEAFADQAVIAVKNSRLYEGLSEEKQRTEQSMRQIVAVNEVAGALVSTLNLEEILELIIERLAHLAGTSHCGVAFFNEEKGVFAGRLARGRGSEQFKDYCAELQDDPALDQMVRERRPVVVNQANCRGRAQETLCQVWNIRTYLVSPLIAKDRVIGAIYLADSRTGYVFGDKEFQLITSFSHFAATAIENAQLYQHAWEKSSELEAILRGIGDGVIVTDTHLSLLLMNPVAVRIFKLGRDVPPGAFVPELIPNEQFDSLLREALENPERAAIKEIEFGAQDNKPPVIYQGLASVISGAEGQIRGLVAVLRDITSQKELERMKSNFLSVVSHELKTPLHSIKGFVDIILMGKTGTVTDVQRDFLTTVKQQTGQLQNLINDLLEFSRLESGQVKLRIEKVSLAALADRVIGKLAPLASDARLRLISSFSDGFPLVEADETRLEQVLTNLVDNAIKFSQAGGQVVVEGRDLGEQVQVSVRDTGIGIPMEEQERIFDRFYQVDGGSTRQHRGTGLGLTICKHIIENHHGRIWVESELGEGSTFYFVLPKELLQEEQIALDFTTLPSQRRG